MIHIQIQIAAEQVRALRQLAAKEGKSVAELIHISLDEILRNSCIRDRANMRRKASAAAGRLRGPKNLAKKHDDYLAEALDQ